MALKVADRVLETCTSPGTGAVTLLGATVGYQTFSAAIGNANTTYYTIADQSGANWEVGVGTYTTSGNTLTRNTVLSSSNGGSLVNFNAGTQNVFVTYPSEEAVYTSNGPGTSGYVLVSAGAGAASIWTAPTSVVGGAGGSNTQVQYNSSGSLAGSANMVFDGFTLTTLNTAYTGTLTGGTGVVNLGSGQFYKDASGNVGIGTSSPVAGLSVYKSNGYVQLTDGTIDYRSFVWAGGSAAATGTWSNHPLLFNTNNAERMRIDSSGNVGIGTTSPAYKLDVNTATNNGIQVTDGIYSGTFVASSLGGMALTTGGAYPLIAYINGAERMRIDSSGNFLINTSLTNLYAQSSGYGVCYRKNASFDVLSTNDNCIILNRTTSTGQLQEFRYNGTVVGSISYNGSLTLYNQTSDQRLKENIVDANTALTTIAKIKIRAFDWIESKTHEAHGIIAQELQEIAPQCVTQGTDNEDGSIKHPWQVDTSPLVPMLIKAIQEQQAMIEELTIRLNALEGK